MGVVYILRLSGQFIIIIIIIIIIIYEKMLSI